MRPAEGGMAAVQIAPVAIRANVAAGTVYRYFPSKADLISELIADVSRDELAAIRRAADAAPGPSSALAAAVTTVAVHVLSQRKLAWGILAEPVDVDVTASRLASRREIAGEIAARIDAAVRAGHLPAQDTALAATALLGALHESLVGPLAPDNLDDPRSCATPFIPDAAGAARRRRDGRPRPRPRGAGGAAGKSAAAPEKSPAIDIALTQPSARLGAIDYSIGEAGAFHDDDIRIGRVAGRHQGRQGRDLDPERRAQATIPTASPAASRASPAPTPKN